MVTAISSSSPSDIPALKELHDLALRLTRLTETVWSGQPSKDVKEAVTVLENIARSTAALKVDILAEVERAGSWSSDGQPTIQAWVSQRTGSTRNNAFKSVGLSQSLSEELPETRKALARGFISEDHAQVLARESTKSESLKKKLSDPNRGEAFLLEQAGNMDATAFTRVVKSWAIESDPKGADKEWRKDTKKEALTVTPGEEGYRISGWLTPANGALLSEALISHMGRKSADDPRSFPERQAGGLMSMVHQGLNSGLQMPHARIRPQLTVTMDHHTLQQLVNATGPSMPEALRIGATQEEHAAWSRNWKPGDDHEISSSLDHQALVGTAPATLPDGTPISPGLLARLACSSLLSRVIFGADSTVLDSGREERIFTASQTRAIIARDQHCRYPGCDEPPSRCEVHHSLEWFKHNGGTHVDLGILLCWHHHTLVHQQELTILRKQSEWIFKRKSGAIISPPKPDAPPRAPRVHIRGGPPEPNRGIPEPQPRTSRFSPFDQRAETRRRATADPNYKTGSVRPPKRPLIPSRQSRATSASLGAEQDSLFNQPDTPPF